MHILNDSFASFLSPAILPQHIKKSERSGPTPNLSLRATGLPNREGPRLVFDLIGHTIAASPRRCAPSLEGLGLPRVIEGYSMTDTSKHALNPGNSRVPVKSKTVFEAVARRMDTFCNQRLNAEYAGFCRALAGALARKRPSPLLQGDPNAWACAILYAIGRVNFLFDKTQSPHLSAAELCSSFGVSQSSVSTKASRIMKMMGMFPLDPRWCLPSLIPNNPLMWLIEVDGFLLDARDAPRGIQEEAFRKGLIPYLPE